jgi:hypothetical protein
MRDKFIGDSYDIVKRFWCESLGAIAPLFSHPRFLPPEIRGRYTAVTLIPVLDLESLPKKPFGILLDPHTGISLPDVPQKGMTISHISLPSLVRIFDELRPQYMICFDQSFHRQSGLSHEKQRLMKMNSLRKSRLASFYYVSHASFLFITDRQEILVLIRDRLTLLGIPPRCFADSQ